MKKLFTFAINNYPGTINDLRGCLNDQKRIIKLFADYDTVALKNEQVTVQTIKEQMTEIVSNAVSGDYIVFHYSGHGTQIPDKNGDEADHYDEALYLHDGALIDDDLCDILSGLKDGVHCLVLLDSCFSGTATRSINLFIQKGRRKLFSRRKKILVMPNQKWNVISASGEHQTSADAFIHGVYEGAFTHYLCRSAKSGQTLEQWYKKMMRGGILRYAQRPELEINENDKQIIFI